ncbi:MAG TPA: hypothetical protein VK513_13815 [Terriglobales bacterium]|nr:hypothetical protein [Terriglobales bacterium]
MNSYSTLSKDGKAQTFDAAPDKDIKDREAFQEIVLYQQQRG